MKITYVLAILFASSFPCIAQTTPQEAQELAAYPLTMDHVTQQYQVLIDLSRQTQADPGLKNQFRDWAKLPLNGQIHLFETNSKAAAIAKAHGIPPRDQVMTANALTAVLIAFPSVEAGKGPNASNKLEFAASSPQHVQFFRDHQAEIMKLAMQMVDAVTKK
jgi:hypothetical protein